MKKFVFLAVVAIMMLSCTSAPKSKMELVIPEISLDKLGPQLDYNVAGKQEMLDMLLKYLAVNSGSIDSSDGSYPMTPGQEEMAALLKADAEALGARTVISEWQYVYVDIPSNIDREVPVMGISCHLDYNTETYGQNLTQADLPEIHPIVIEYKGGDIEQAPGRYIRADSIEGADLAGLVGKTIIHTDGTTVLGGDDKNGCTIVMSLIKTLMQEGVRHGRVQIVFAPNEDIGGSAVKIDTTLFNPDILFDVDGMGGSQVMAANFTARTFNVDFLGHDAYPGWAKELKLGDSLAAAAEFISFFPLEYRPERTEGYEGYIHPYELAMEKVNDEDGHLQKKYTVKTRLRYFDPAQGELFVQQVKDAIAQVENDYPYVKTSISLDEFVYDNVANTMNPASYTVLGRAAARTGLTLDYTPIRAGTTSAMFATMGLTAGMCLFSGQHNEHTPSEYSCLEEIMDAYKLLLYTVDEVANL